MNYKPQETHGPITIQKPNQQLRKRSYANAITEGTHRKASNTDVTIRLLTPKETSKETRKSPAKHWPFDKTKNITWK